MTTTIAQRELRNDNARVIAAVAAGETFVITRHGRPVAELRPIVEGRRTLVPTAELAAMFGQGPAVDAAAFRADADRLLDNRLLVARDGEDPR
jgi:prevent-host-death family protein